eukprot:c10327_g1_i2.p1 GENE.c10327_g1_i2~~c10327_g1_i2.p1  ORF type:complete len:224 (+),score=31.05 c10327_g1_i2:55-726(+)
MASRVAHLARLARVRGLCSKNPQFGHRPLTPEQRERTLIVLKPDTVQRGLVGQITTRFENKGFKVCGLKITTPTRELAEKHYAVHKDKPFFPRACRFLCSGPCVAMVWEGLDVVATLRMMLGPTNPAKCPPGTIRGDFASHFRRNLVHASDSVESAQTEIGIWFQPNELVDWDHSMANWILELQNAPIDFDHGEYGHVGHLAGHPNTVNQTLEFNPTYNQHKQ